MRGHLHRHASSLAAAATTLLMLVVAIAAAACGGSDTTTSPSPTAEPAPAATSPSAEPSESAASLPAPSVDGTIALSRVVADDNADIFVVRADGTRLKQLTDTPRWEEHPTWSPDGKHIVYDVGSNSYPGNDPDNDPSVWVMNADGSGKVKLTKGYLPHWSPDGRQIVFMRYSRRPLEHTGWPGDVILVMNADGSDVRLVTEEQKGQGRPSWTPDGRVLFTDGLDEGSVVNLDGSGRRTLKPTKGKGAATMAASPNGRLFAFASSIDIAVDVAALSGKGPAKMVLEGLWDYLPGKGDVTVAWTPDGKALAVANSTGGGTAGDRIFVFNVDGSGLSAVPGIDNAIDPDWRPR